MKILVTGGAGFIGSNFILNLIRNNSGKVLNLDKLTYAGNLKNLHSVQENSDYQFVRGDIGERALVEKWLKEFKPEAIINFAAESHVDRSIHSPSDFIQTNIVGVFNLLEEILSYWKEMAPAGRKGFRFLHISTDEVYGSLKAGDPPFSEASAYQPNSPYAASKAASDHLVRAYCHTYGLPVLTTNCSNNYGPWQYPEKLIPLVILNALREKPLPVYGDGKNIRDWLYVEDHCDAIRIVLEKGKPGETYNIGGSCEKSNIDVVRAICETIGRLKPRPKGRYEDLIQFVTDRPGHDRRYAINAEKMKQELGWKPKENFTSGLEKTVRWVLEHPVWYEEILSGSYEKWIEANYGQRKGRT